MRAENARVPMSSRNSSDDEPVDLPAQDGQGIDRTAIRALLRLTPAERLNTLRDEARTLERLLSARRVQRLRSRPPCEES
jgi:hypothetical protein